MIAGLFIVVVAASTAFFLPAYQAMLPFQFPMDVTEAHRMGIYLLVVGVIFVWLVRPRRAKKPTQIEPKSEVK